jgi:hypothetical protein
MEKVRFFEGFEAHKGPTDRVSEVYYLSKSIILDPLASFQHEVDFFGTRISDLGNRQFLHGIR